MRKLNYKDVEVLFKEKGFILLEEEYKNSKEKMKFKCKKHLNDIQYITVSKLKNGGCKKCTNEKRKVDFSLVKETFEEKGFILLEEKYKNISTKMRCKCKKHLDENQYMSLKDIRYGRKCEFCDSNMKYEEASNLFEEKGFVLLEKQYKNTSTKMKCKCKKHLDKIQYKSLSSIKMNEGCKFCTNNVMSYEEVSNLYDKKGYILLEKQYKNASTKMKCKCKKHSDKIQYKRLSSIKLDDGCSYCFHENNKGENHSNWKKELTDKDRNQIGRKNSQYKKWRFDVLNRDNYTCQCCGNNNNIEQLNAHHINSWNYFKEGRYDITNGVCLCVSCHKNFHFIYGYGNNTEEQFNKFLKNNREYKNVS
ncbi:HNH endonuclease [Virgibacillus sp. DJP39]|uniref:HNH endonuclease n=1 Tax=Virgibacillus sp. DJP39 TaxID=3409790 RepID=UPI003BB5A037